ncbi:hypothetical protein BGM19_26660 [Streptomyces agglomeratus]|nr:hypothetical protein BGM19_26660 [Streptomyces agglomeratus]
MSILEQRPSITAALLRWSAFRLRRADQFRRIAHATALQAVAQVILSLVERFGQDDRLVVTVPVTRDDLAGLAGKSRASCERVLRMLREAEVVDTGYRRLRVLDYGRLLRYAQVGDPVQEIGDAFRF